MSTPEPVFVLVGQGAGEGDGDAVGVAVGAVVAEGPGLPPPPPLHAAKKIAEHPNPMRAFLKNIRIRPNFCG